MNIALRQKQKKSTRRVRCCRHKHIGQLLSRRLLNLRRPLRSHESEDVTFGPWIFDQDNLLENSPVFLSEGLDDLFCGTVDRAKERHLVENLLG